MACLTANAIGLHTQQTLLSPARIHPEMKICPASMPNICTWNLGQYCLWLSCCNDATLRTNSSHGFQACRPNMKCWWQCCAAIPESDSSCDAIQASSVRKASARHAHSTPRTTAGLHLRRGATNYRQLVTVLSLCTLNVDILTSLLVYIHH